MKKILAFTLLFVSVAAALANQVLTLNLSQVQLTASDYEKDFFIADVIDARPEKQCLGFVHTGLVNNRKPVYSQRPLDDELFVFFAKTFQKEAGKAAIVVRVNHLFIYEMIYNDREYAFAELNLSFLKKENNHFIEMLETGTTVEKTGMDVTRHHPVNIANAIAACFKEFNEKRKTGNLLNRVVATSEMKTYPLSGRDYPVFHARPAGKGIYKTFNDFRQVQPQPMPLCGVEYYRAKDKSVVVADLTCGKTTAKDVYQIWGFNDGTDDYIRIGKSFYQIKNTGEGFRVMAPVVKNNNGAVVGAAAGGIIGGLVGGLIDAASVKYSEYQLDFITGGILPPEEPTYRKIESRLLLCSSRYSRAEMLLEVEGMEKCRLNPGEYVKMTFPPETTSVSLCIEAANGRVCDTIPLELFNRTICLLSTFKNKPPKIDLPNKTHLAELRQDLHDGKFTPVCESEGNR